MSAVLNERSASPEETTSGTVNYLTRPGVLERALVVLTLFTYAWGQPLEWFDFVDDGATESSVLTRALFLGFFVHSVISLNGNWHVVLATMKREPLLPAFVVLLWVSALWSTVPVVTFQEGVILIIAYITAMHLLVRFTLREIVAMLGIVFATGIVISIGFIAVFENISELSLTTEAGDDSAGWRGITGNKNTLARAAVLGFIVCGVQARVLKSHILWPGLALLHVVVVLGTNSATALGALFTTIALVVVLLGFRGRKTLYGATMVMMIIVFTTVTTLAATNLAAATGLLGKDSTFTGRLPIWADSFRFGVSERPFLGFGHAGFWRHGVVDFDVQLRSNNFDIPHAHNAWVDAWLEVGPLGVVLITAFFVRGLLWGTRRVRALPTTLGMFPALVISAGVIYSTSEAGFVNRTIHFIMFTVALTEAARQKGVEEPYRPLQLTASREG